MSGKRPAFTQAELDSAKALIEYEGEKPRPFLVGWPDVPRGALLHQTTSERHIPPGFKASYLTEGWNNVVRSVKMPNNDDLDGWLAKQAA